MIAQFFKIHCGIFVSCELESFSSKLRAFIFYGHLKVKKNARRKLCCLQFSKRTTKKNYIIPCLICTLIRKSQAPCKIYPIFSEWQKYLRFSRAWHPFFSDLPYETQLILRLPPQKISFATLKKIG